MSEEIVWEDLPLRRLTNWREKLEPLKSKPTCWARVKEFDSNKRASSKGSQLRSGYIKSPVGEWEFAARGNYLYARYIGPENGTEAD